MPSEKRYLRVLAVLCLGSLAGAVHAQDAWHKTMAVAAFPDVKGNDGTALAARTTTSSEVLEGTDLKREFGPRRSTRGAVARLPDLLPNPYDAAANDNLRPAPRDKDGSDTRADGLDRDERWANPYAVARLAENDERWANPYGAARNVGGDERWANPYAPSVQR